MAKIDKLIKKYTQADFADPALLLKAIKQFSGLRETLEKLVQSYGDPAKLSNWQEPWYINAHDAYEEDLHKVDSVLLILQGKYASTQTTAVLDKV